MKIYTRTGDDGTTGLFGGERVEKDEPVVEAYGSVDELNAGLGMVAAALTEGETRSKVVAIQSDLFRLGAELGCAPGKEDRLGLTLLGGEDIARLEGFIDGAEAQLPALKSFILPGGSEAGARLHQARTLCRRTERRVHAARHVRAVRREVLVYLNRLGDLLFVLARLENLRASAPEIPWPIDAGSRAS